MGVSEAGAHSRILWTQRRTPLHSVSKADVAQLVEQSIRNRQVIGSSPIVGSILSLLYRQIKLVLPRIQIGRVSQLRVYVKAIETDIAVQSK